LGFLKRGTAVTPIQRDPTLLIAPQGADKPKRPNRLAAAHQLGHRHYNAGLLNIDDLGRLCTPNGAGGLDYVQTPASTRRAQSVLTDEISRCRPAVQNRLSIHERCVRGLPLPDLVSGWPAMNRPWAAMAK
jgi:MoxR-like ATPase